MSKISTKKNTEKLIPHTLEERLEILRRTQGAWKHRSLKKDLKTLEKIRKSWDRKIT